MKKFNIMAVTAAVLIGSAASAVSAATFNHVSTSFGGLCAAGVNFRNCTNNGDATIAKFRFKRGTALGSKFNTSAFPSLDGTELGVNLTTNGSGTWTYSPTGADPVVTAFMVKSGKKFSVFQWDTTSGTDFSSILWDTSTLAFPNSSRERPLKKIMFFGAQAPSFGSDTVSAVPLPAAGLLLIAGLGGLAGLRRRRKS